MEILPSTARVTEFIMIIVVAVNSFFNSAPEFSSISTRLVVSIMQFIVGGETILLLIMAYKFIANLVKRKADEDFLRYKLTWDFLHAMNCFIGIRMSFPLLESENELHLFVIFCQIVDVVSFSF